MYFLTFFLEQGRVWGCYILKEAAIIILETMSLFYVGLQKIKTRSVLFQALCAYLFNWMNEWK